MAVPKRNLTKRLLNDLEEFRKNPLTDVSAFPLEDNMLEWHCNIRGDDSLYHVILFFPDNYPFSPPKTEVVTPGFHYAGGITLDGVKGKKLCLDLFNSVQLNQHVGGWSPAYTAQSLLVNLLSFLVEKGSNIEAGSSKDFKCPDCGHTNDKPFPPLGVDGLQEACEGNTLTTNADTPEIIDYISKETPEVQKPKSAYDLYGFGVTVSDSDDSGVLSLTTPFELLNGRTFYTMKRNMTFVCSVLADNLSFFMPLSINSNQGLVLEKEFEKFVKQVMTEISPSQKIPLPEMALKTIFMMMKSVVNDFYEGPEYTSDKSIRGYFTLHRQLLWAVERYSDADLQNHVESRLEKFMESPDNRSLDTCLDLEELLFLASASRKYRWQDLADAYLYEIFKKSAMEYVVWDIALANEKTQKAYRLKHTFWRSIDRLKQCALGVCLLNVAMPKEMSYEEIIQRYDAHMGFPTKEMVRETKATFNEINDRIENYAHWFTLLKLPVPTEDQLSTRLAESVRSASLSKDFPLEKRSRKGRRWRLGPYDRLAHEAYPGTRRKTLRMRELKGKRRSTKLW